jgi:hypothetical protein
MHRPSFGGGQIQIQRLQPQQQMEQQQQQQQHRQVRVQGVISMEEGTHMYTHLIIFPYSSIETHSNIYTRLFYAK